MTLAKGANGSEAPDQPAATHSTPRATNSLSRLAAPRQGAVVQVAVPRPLRRLFDYAATDAPPPAGARVRVPFGGASVVGVVVGGRDGSEHRLKFVQSVLDDEPLLPPDLLALAQWLADYYHHPIGDVFATLLPAKARRGAPALASEDPFWQPVEGGEEALLRAPRQREALARLRQASGARTSDLRGLGIERRHLLALEAKHLARRRADAPTPAMTVHDSAHHPNPAQAAAIKAITASLGTAAVHLLDGVTGSGKTEVYMQVIAEVVRAGGQALVLVPEIALTPQTVARFQARFAAVAALHSAASDRERFDTWLKCRGGVHQVLIGTRSAVLAPFARLGVIVVDEEHDGSFKQTEGLRYSARDVAVKRGQMLNIPVVLGSATPSMESLENARAGRYARLRLLERAGGARLPAFQLLDIRGERLEHGFSPSLHASIARHLNAGNQVLVFINRRGYAPVLLCGRCGWRARCDHCDVNMAFHRPGRQLRCHQCGASRPTPAACPACDSEVLTLVGTGTQRAEEALRERHPHVPLHRVDGDTARRARWLRDGLEAVRDGAPAILVGTQMLAKGHHLPSVTLVAVLDADGGFLAPDFRAPERTAQLIVQVAGRAGRAERPGEVVIQTFDPQDANLQALVRSGYHGFVASERGARAAAAMPPFSALALVRAQSKAPESARCLLGKAAEVLADDAVETLGPAPANIARRADLHRWQLLAMAPRRRHLHRALTRLEQAAPHAPGVSWTIDVDPLDTL